MRSVVGGDWRWEETKERTSESGMKKGKIKENVKVVRNRGGKPKHAVKCYKIEIKLINKSSTV